MGNFFNDYVNKLIYFHLVPKFQNERVLSTILSIFIEDIINNSKDVKKTKEEYEFVTIELPINEIRQSGDCLYIDYCLVNKKGRNIALLVELKVEGTVYAISQQIKDYKKLKDEVNAVVNSKKLKDFIPDKFKRKENTRQDLKKRGRKTNSLRKFLSTKLDKVTEIKILYIAPNYIFDKLDEYNKCHEDIDVNNIIEYRISFEEMIEMNLPLEKINSKVLVSAWKKITKYLEKLNEP
jgi:hypothetical protein